VDEVLKEAGQMVDVLSMEGFKMNSRIEINRQVLAELSSNPQFQALVPEEKHKEVTAMLATALLFGSVDTVITSKSAMELYNKELRANLDFYNRFMEKYEDKRFIDAGMISLLFEQINAAYAQMPPPVQNIYGEVKSKIAGPHSVVVFFGKGKVEISTAGLEVLNNFLPSVADIIASETYKQASGIGEGGGEDW